MRRGNDGLLVEQAVLRLAARCATGHGLSRRHGGVIERYRIKPDVRRALMDDDVAALSPLVNAYLLRFYFQVRGMPQDEFMARLHAMNAPDASAAKVGHG